jgi:hypothetical protein
MPLADDKYISLRGKEIHYFEQSGQGPTDQHRPR